MRRRSIDIAYWGSTVEHGPSGLESLAGVQTVDVDDEWTSLDPMVEGISKLQAIGATATNFVNECVHRAGPFADQEVHRHRQRVE